MSNVYQILMSQGFIRFPCDDENVVHAEKAFFGGRVIEWIRERAKDPDFNLQVYLIALTYFKLDLADLKFKENELLYRYRGINPGGSEDESLQNLSEDDKLFHRPDEVLNSDGTISGPLDH